MFGLISQLFDTLGETQWYGETQWLSVLRWFGETQWF